MVRTNDEKSEQIESRLTEAGVPRHAVDAVLEIDALMQNWRRRMRTRELGNRAIAELGLEIDLVHLDVLTAIAAPAREFGVTGETDEIVVGTVAERLMIDPSRASRLVSDMVERGHVMRLASQADSRRTVITLTDSGKSIVEAVRAYKYFVMADYLGDWTQAELEAFLPLLERFTAWSDRAETAAEGRFGAEIEALRDRVAAQENV